MKPVLIIKTGKTVSRVAPERGDFEDWIIQGMALPAEQFIVAAVFEDDALPALDSISAIVVTGSAAMVTDRADWSERSAQYIQNAVIAEIPVLGICYGHQLLAHALGGVVDYHPRGREIGALDIRLSEAANSDLLLSELPLVFKAHSSHSQSVLELPPGSKVLASNDFEAHHAVRFSEKAWGLQFHPEFDAAIMRAYLQERESDLRLEGIDVDGLLDSTCEAPEAASILEKFAAIIRH